MVRHRTSLKQYTADFSSRSAVSLVRDGANVMVFRTFDKIHALAGLPIGYVHAPRGLANALRKLGAGDAESLGRLNIVAASAALRDTAQAEQTRNAVAHERLQHAETEANFVFFNAGIPQPKLAAAMLSHGIDIGRAHPPYAHWAARIAIGLLEENQRAQAALRHVLEGAVANRTSARNESRSSLSIRLCCIKFLATICRSARG